MAEYDSKKKTESLSKEKMIKEQEKKAMRETFDRLTAPVHVTLNSWREHERIEGYYEFQDYGHLFSCDRLLKLETVYGKVQMGYNPNRMRSFVFANMKTNRYDAVNSRYQKAMKEYQQRPEQKKGNENRAWLSGRWKNAAVLLEKAENKPWSERSMEPYFNSVNMEALLKTMPFFGEERERAQLEERKSRIVALQNQVRENALEKNWQENRQINRQMREASEEAALLSAILARKDAGKRAFIRKLNYAFDIDKNSMFDYYREQRRRALREEISAIEPQEGEAAGENRDTEEDND